jgi:hypothetical protein
MFKFKTNKNNVTAHMRNLHLNLFSNSLYNNNMSNKLISLFGLLYAILL